MSDAERWAHFMPGWEVDDVFNPSEFRCKRCSTIIETSEARHDHRKGLLISECSIRRLRQWLNRNTRRRLTDE